MWVEGRQIGLFDQKFVLNLPAKLSEIFTIGKTVRVFFWFILRFGLDLEIYSTLTVWLYLQVQVLEDGFVECHLFVIFGSLEIV